MSKTEEETELDVISLSEFLANCPPQTSHHISDFYRTVGTHSGQRGFTANTPDIEIHCPSEKCKTKGLMTYRVSNVESIKIDHSTEIKFFQYECSNCREETKLYATIYASNTEVSSPRVIRKIGEYPNFGPPIPSRLITMVGGDRELFLKGRTCENQGLGIAAFAYYRRVIESQKNRIFDQIVKVAELIEPGSALINELKDAKSETQFTKSVDKIKTAIPQGLMISGHNPLKLLHSALSEGLHAQSDEECLEIASEVRVVLARLAEKITDALDENKEVHEAVKKLAQRQAEAKT